jgi:3-oxoacyl-[acyl-carrier-protein] synthase-3
MQIIKIGDVALEAVYACLPENDIDNLAACAVLYGERAADVVKGVGMEHRRVASSGVSSLDLCVAAAKRLLSESPDTVKEIGAVICVTFTPDQLMPANAIAAQHELGLCNDILAFDVNLACSGYGYGLWLAATTARQLGRKVLLLDGDVQTAFTSPYDKGTVPVMSDAGTATLVSPRVGGTEWSFTFYSDGSNRKALGIPAGGSKRPVNPSELVYIEYPDGSRRREIDISMDGFEIFKFVAQVVSRQLSSFLSELGLQPGDIGAFVPHQANIYMIKQLSRKIGVPLEKVWISGDKYGNSSSATIPVTIASELLKRMLPGDTMRILLSGFGAGLSVSAGVIELAGSIKHGLLNFGQE